MAHTFHKKIYLFSAFFLFTGILFLSTLTPVYGATEKFSPLVGLPGITDMGTATIPQYVNAVYLVLIGLGSLIGVVRIVWIGVKYSLSESVVHKVDAKHDIMGVFIGLGVLLIPFMVLNTINPNLTNLNVLELAPKLTIPPPTKTIADKLPTTKIFNKNFVESCLPEVGKALSPACPPGVTQADVLNSASCDGYYDLAVKLCFSKSSSYTYTVGATGGSGNYSTFSEEGWIRLCGGEDKIKVDSDDVSKMTYSCK